MIVLWPMLMVQVSLFHTWPKEESEGAISAHNTTFQKRPTATAEVHSRRHFDIRLFCRIVIVVN